MNSPVVWSKLTWTVCSKLRVRDNVCRNCLPTTSMYCLVWSKPTWPVCSKLRGGEIAYCEFSRGMVKANMDRVF